MSITAPLETTTTSAPLAERYRRVREFSRQLCETLCAEDCCIQSMPDVSPTRWHLAHTTWFFETFILANQPGYQSDCDEYAYLFNSYYNAVGEQFPRAQRGVLSRPTVDQVKRYRESVDRRMEQFFAEDDFDHEAVAPVIELGLHHEQQHQELMLTDIKHVFSCNPLFPQYREGTFVSLEKPPALDWETFDEAIYWIGHEDDGFSYDNESPRHRVFLEEFQLADRLVTCGEFLEFVEDGGYRRPELWLAEGWLTVQENSWSAPFYWRHRDGQWFEFTLAGLVPLDLNRPVCHVSYFEADAFARWAGTRLPTEAEWEVASQQAEIGGNFVDQLLASGKAIHPQATAAEATLRQMFGDLWQWTSSSYAPYPGYQPPRGALGEYNGKFMCNQYVLRGGSCATSSDHIRRTYRNFFPTAARWQFTGIRLAK